MGAKNTMRGINCSVMCCSCHYVPSPYLPQEITNTHPHLLRYTFVISIHSGFLPFGFVPFIFSTTELPRPLFPLPSSPHSTADCLFWCMVALQSGIRMSNNGKRWLSPGARRYPAAHVVVMETTRIPAL